MPKDKKDLPKKQAKRGNLPLPMDVIVELRDWKLAYEIARSDPSPDGKQYSMTYEQLIRRLLEGVKRLDPEVWAVHEAREKTREEQDELMADFRKRFWPELMSTRNTVNKFYDEMIGEIMKDDRADGDSLIAVKTEQIATPKVPAEVRKRWEETYWFFDPEGNKFKAVIKTIQGLCSFFPENASNLNQNCRCLLVRLGWKMTDDHGNELKYRDALEIVEEFEKYHGLR